MDVVEERVVEGRFDKVGDQIVGNIVLIFVKLLDEPAVNAE